MRSTTCAICQGAIPDCKTSDGHTCLCAEFLRRSYASDFEREAEERRLEKAVVEAAMAEHRLSDEEPEASIEEQDALGAARNAACSALAKFRKERT